MTKVSKRIGLALGLAALLLGFVGVGAAQAAIPDSDISQNTVHSTAYRVGNGSNLQFYGALQAKAYGGQNYCYQVQYLTPEGNWTVDGFRTGDHNIPEQPMTHCSTDPEPYQTWTILAGLDVRGIRFTNGVNTGTHCNTATTCRAMYQGT